MQALYTTRSQSLTSSQLATWLQKAAREDEKNTGFFAWLFFGHRSIQRAVLCIESIRLALAHPCVRLVRRVFLVFGASPWVPFGLAL
jgi:hypothetical protein